MKISELSTVTEVPVATLKYYLREGLLRPGRAVSRTQADYDSAHVARVRLVRALTGVGGLSLTTTRRVLEVIDEPSTSRADLLGAAQGGLYGADFVGVPSKGGPLEATSRARAWLLAMGWQVHPEDPVIDELDRAWEACDAAGLGLDEERMTAYARSVLEIAAVDVASVPQEPEAAVRQVVLGTILVDRVLSPLRRLADQHVATGEGG